MGVLVHVNCDEELANGVAVTKNPYNRDWPVYINVQVGDILVTNPAPSAIPDELLIAAIGPLASLGEGGVHGQIKFGVQAAVSAAVVN